MPGLPFSRSSLVAADGVNIGVNTDPMEEAIDAPL